MCTHEYASSLWDSHQLPPPPKPCLHNTEDVIPRLLTFSSQIRNHAVSYLPQLQPGVIADELDVADPVDGPKPPQTHPAAPPATSINHPTTSVPAVLSTTPSSNTPVVAVHGSAHDITTPPSHDAAAPGSCGNNILAPTLRQWRRLRSFRQHVQPAVHAGIGQEVQGVPQPVVHAVGGASKMGDGAGMVLHKGGSPMQASTGTVGTPEGTVELGTSHDAVATPSSPPSPSSDGSRMPWQHMSVRVHSSAVCLFAW